MKIKSISKQALAVLLSLAVLASTLMLNTFSVFASGTEGSGSETTGSKTSGVWDGTEAEGFAGGDGLTEETAFEIATPAQLALLGKTVANNPAATKDKYYELTADIILNDINNSDDGVAWYLRTDTNLKQWTYGTQGSFLGTLNGGGKVIKGLYIKSATSSHVGLFKCAEGSATIKNLGMEYTYLENNYIRNDKVATGCAGAFVGSLYNAKDQLITFENCYVADTVTVSGGLHIGGFIGEGTLSNGGETSLLTIKNCYSSAVMNHITPVHPDGAEVKIAGDRCKSSFVGFWYVPQCLAMKNCYSTQAGLQLVSGYYGRNFYSDFTGVTDEAVQAYIDGLFKNCYCRASMGYNKSMTGSLLGDGTFSGVNVITADKMTGKGAEANMSKLFTGEGEGAWEALIGYTPQLVKFGKEDKAWDGTFVSAPLLKTPGEKNSKENPYLITSSAELAYLGKLSVDDNPATDQYYKLTKDIVLNDTTDPNWKSNNPVEWVYGKQRSHFRGILDGDGHVIKGLYIVGGSNEFNYIGLFSYLYGTKATIKNLGMEDSYIENGYIRGDNYATGCAGAFVGCLYNDKDQLITFENCYVADTVTVSGGLHIGGFIGEGTLSNGGETSLLTIKNCYSSAVMNHITPVHPDSAEVKIAGDRCKSSFVGFWYVPQCLAMINCYSTQAGLQLVSGYYSKNFYSDFTGVTDEAVQAYIDGLFKNCYCRASMGYNKSMTGSLLGDGTFSGVNVITADKMIGKGAEANMSKLFTGAGEGAWETLIGYTPQLVIFGKEDKAWDGTFVSAPVLKTPGEVNSKENPYLITNSAELAYLFNRAATDNTKTEYYKLTKDIVINDTTDPEWTSKQPISWLNTGSAVIAFRGDLDGDGHVIKGLYVDNNTGTWGGLFTHIVSANIRNLGIVDSYFNYTASNAVAGAFAAYIGSGDGINGSNQPSNISNCYIANTTINGNIVGGFFGSNNEGRVLNFVDSYSSNVTLPNNANTGAFVGNCGNNGTTNFTRCYSDADLDFVINSRSIITDSYGLKSGTQLKAEDMIGGNAVMSMGSLFVGQSPWYVMTGETPKLVTFLDAANKAKLEVKGDLNMDSLVDIRDLVCYAQAKNNTPVGIIHESNEVITGTKFADHTTEALKKFILGESFEEMKLPEPLKITTDNVKLLGRSVALSEGVSLDHSASTLEFTTTGTSSVYLTGEYTCTQEGDLYFTVYINGERQSKRVKFASGKSKVLIANKLDTNQTTTIKLVRQTEEKYGSFTALSFDLGPDGALGEKPANKGTYIEFLGDSITCGLGSLHGFLSDDYLTIVDEGGNECNIDSGENSRCEDATNGYAYLAAEKLGADYSLLSYSGIGVSTGYFGNFQMKDYFKLASKSRNVEYTPTRTPDLVVINLGTNDVKDLKDDTSIENFKVAVKALIAQVRETYGENVKILWATGIMGEAGKDYAATAIAEIKNQNNLWHFTGLTEGRNGHSGHPNKVQAEKAAQDLYEFINTNNILTNN